MYYLQLSDIWLCHRSICMLPEETRVHSQQSQWPHRGQLVRTPAPYLSSATTRLTPRVSQTVSRNNGDSRSPSISVHYQENEGQLEISLSWPRPDTLLPPMSWTNVTSRSLDT